ncbi:hypothetical protein C805_00031 [Eubacterium sp. 14-2]|uniref:hypothetical protein n=1 Tax=Eubacterium sp. 14-2 TaxID=1235790 RepID=UPI00033C3D8A|nr:hypothetical protein [Eubacterium sp. 14-2]EOT29448.1 hypothetical protein C805_00031 [Eubacterium sp. 14-2]
MKKNIDIGKIIALRKVKWTHDKIADEMRMEKSDYEKVLFAYIDKLDAKIRIMEKIQNNGMDNFREVIPCTENATPAYAGHA